MEDITLRELLREAESSLKQARKEVWEAFDALVDSDPQTAVDDLIAEMDRRVSPLVDAVMRLGGDPRLCWP